MTAIATSHVTIRSSNETTVTASQRSLKLLNACLPGLEMAFAIANAILKVEITTLVTAMLLRQLQAKLAFLESSARRAVMSL